MLAMAITRTMAAPISARLSKARSRSKEYAITMKSPASNSHTGTDSRNSTTTLRGLRSDMRPPRSMSTASAPRDSSLRGSGRRADFAHRPALSGARAASTRPAKPSTNGSVIPATSSGHGTLHCRPNPSATPSTGTNRPMNAIAASSVRASSSRSTKIVISAVVLLTPSRSPT